MKPPRVVLVLALSVFALSVPASARAALIGLAGGDYDPPPITDPGPFNFFACSDHTDQSFLSNSVCVFYNAFDDVQAADFEGFDNIFSLDLFLLGAQFVVGENLVLSKDSALRKLNDSSIPGAFSLSGGSIAPPPIKECGPNTIECFVPPPSNYTVALFLTPQYGESLQFLLSLSTSNAAVNGIPTVPEPGTLLLMGPAALGLLAARRRRAVRRRSA